MYEISSGKKKRFGKRSPREPLPFFEFIGLFQLRFTPFPIGDEIHREEMCSDIMNVVRNIDEAEILKAYAAFFLGFSHDCLFGRFLQFHFAARRAPLTCSV